MRRMFLLTSLMLGTVAVSAASLCNGSSAGVAIDTTSGVRTAAASETIRYSPSWAYSLEAGWECLENGGFESSTIYAHDGSWADCRNPLEGNSSGWEFGGNKSGVTRAESPWTTGSDLPVGGCAAFVQMSGVISRQFQIPVAGTYLLSFLSSARPTMVLGHPLDVYVDETKCLSVVSSNSNYRVNSVLLNLEPGSHRIRFQGAGGETADQSTILDDISLTPAGVTVEVFVNGALLETEAATGSLMWSPSRNGTYRFEHRVMNGTTQVGETLSATFVAEGLNPGEPVVTPESGTTFDSSLTVTMSCPSDGATIHYTTDGSEPTLESPVYKRFRISGKTTIKARAFYENGDGSEVVTAEYALGRCDDPVISLADGTVFQHADQEVSIACGDEGVLRYTLDGMEPTADSPVYAGPFTVSESTVVKAKVFSDRFFDSQVVTANLTREWVPVATPVITAAESFTGSKTKVVIACATEGALVRYTTNGSDPNSHSTKYTGPFYVTAGCTVKAYGVLNDYLNSEITVRTISKVWGIGDTLGRSDHAFTTGGDAGFVRVTDATAPRGESMKSGAIGNDQVSEMTTQVTGPGTVSFQWKISCEEDEESHDWDHAEFLVDGVEVARQDGVTGWKTVSARVEGAGAHTLVWRYVKDDVEKDGEDCIWVADFAWTSDLTATQTTDVPVPYAWLLANCRDAVDEYDVYEAVAKQLAANGRQTVADCYVAGLDPEDPAAEFKAVIEMVDGAPVVTPSPDLKDARVYRVSGRTALGDAEGWQCPATANHRFFKISVELP